MGNKKFLASGALLVTSSLMFYTQYYSPFYGGYLPGEKDGIIEQNYWNMVKKYNRRKRK